MNKKKRSKLIAVLAVVFVLLVIVAVWLAKGGKEEGTQTGESTNVGESTEQSVPAGLPVETKYGEFLMSDEWYDYFEYEIIEDDVYQVDFKATYEKSEVVLFSLIFADEIEDAVLLGSMKAEEDTVNVFMELDEIVIPDDLPAEKHDAFYGMQEEVNNIIDQLNQMDGFEAAE